MWSKANITAEERRVAEVRRGEIKTPPTIEITVIHSRHCDCNVGAGAAQLRFRQSQHKRESETRRRDQGDEISGRNQASEGVDQSRLRCAFTDTSIQIS